MQATASETICPTGKYVQIVFLFARCVLCGEGMYQPVQDTTVRECIQCPAGKFMLREGAVKCDVYHTGELVWHSKMSKAQAIAEVDAVDALENSRGSA